jgi:hypothetical protein
MKAFLVIILLFHITSVFGQSTWVLGFENDPPDWHYYQDTVTNPDCLWQIGTPAKSVFTSTVFGGGIRALITDTLNPVVSNDTSVFYLRHYRDNSVSWHPFTVAFFFQLDGDSSDMGMVEISPDTGHTWINLLTEDTLYNIVWYNPKPTLKGSTNAWTVFNIGLTNWASNLDTFPVSMTADTILFRVSYMTGAHASPRDGWIIDRIIVQDGNTNINNVSGHDVYLYPNPTSGVFYVSSRVKNASISISNISGQVIYRKDFELGISSADITHLPPGIYFVKILAPSRDPTMQMIIKK